MSTAGTWLSVHNLRAQLRAIRSHCPGLEHVTPHTLRRTVATLLENQVSLADASAQLGHASEAITESAYVKKPAKAPDNASILQALAPDPD